MCMTPLQGGQYGSWRTGVGGEIRAVVGCASQSTGSSDLYSLWSRKPPEGHDRRRLNLVYASVRKEDMTGRWLDLREGGNIP